MPGGAPLTKRRAASKRPCKYGPRDENGLCPKKPRTTRATSSTTKTRAKAPCKYGPRDASGHCPKKPKTAAAPRVRDYESVSSAAKQAGQVLRSKKATKEQKHEAVKVLGTAVATESGKKVVEHAVRESRKALKTPAGRAAVAKAARAATKAAKAVGTATAIGGVLAIGGAALDAHRRSQCVKWARKQLALTKKRGVKTTPEQDATLLAQYQEYCEKQPPDNSFLGK